MIQQGRFPFVTEYKMVDLSKKIPSQIVFRRVFLFRRESAGKWRSIFFSFHAQNTFTYT